MGVQFNYPDPNEFAEVVAPLTEEVLNRNTKLKPFYEKIQAYNKEYPAKGGAK